MRQLKHFLKFQLLNLIFVLAACSGVEASQPAPVKEASPVDQSQPQGEAVTRVEAVKEVGNAPAMAEKIVVTAEVEPTPEKVMTASTEKVEDVETKPVATAGTAPEQEVMAAEATPIENKTMAEPAAVSSPGPTEAQLQLLAGLENRGVPPELLNEVWLNSEPLKLADLRGKVVIVEFWTFG
jgi:hypothetical protein